MTRIIRLSVRAAAWAVVAGFSSAAFGQATLTHDYSFNNAAGAGAAGDIFADSVAGANATLAIAGTGTASYTGSAVSLNAGVSSNANGAYIVLPNNILPSSGDATFEVWGTYSTTSAGNWERILDIGNGTTNNLFLTPKSGSNDTRFRENTGVEQGLIVGGTPGLTNSEVLFTGVISANGTGATMSLYLNGLLLGSATTTQNLSNLVQNTGKNYLGKSQYADPYLNGSLDEFRTYSGAMKPGQILQNSVLGPTVQTATLNTWNGNSTTSFSDANSWTNGHVPVAGEAAIINGIGVAGYPVVNDGVAVNSPVQTQIQNGTLTVTGAGTVFTPAAGIDLQPGSSGSGRTATLVISGGGVLATPAIFVDSDITTTGDAAKTITLDGGTLKSTAAFTVGGTNLTVNIASSGGIDTTGGNITLNVPLSGSGTGTFTKSGANTLFLTQANTYGGATAVAAGTLNFVHNGIPAGSALTVGTSTTSGTLQWSTGNTDDITSGRTVTLAGNGPAQGAIFDTNGNNVTLAGNLAGTTGYLSKVGAGTLTLNGAATPTDLFVRNGSVVLDGSAASVSTSNYVSIGQLNGDVGAMVVRNGAKLKVTGDFNVSDVNVTKGSFQLQDTGSQGSALSAKTMYIGKSGGSIGALSQAGGAVTPIAGGGDWRIGGAAGTGDAAAVGTYDLSSGSFTTSYNFQMGAWGHGQFNMTGGSVTITAGYPDVGRFTTGIGQLNVSGGTFAHNVATTLLIIGESGVGTLNVYGTGTVSSTGASLLLGSKNEAAGTGFLNLGTGGTVTVKAITTNAASTASTVNFHGGTLKAQTGAAATFMNGLSNAYVWPEGGTIDTNGSNITIGQALVPPSGNGLSSIPLTAGGSGYVTAPIVQIARGAGDTTGFGASAVAIINSSGAVTGFTITNPGVGYTATPVVTLLGGLPATAATTGTIATAVNGSTGGITKANTAGVLTLTNTNTYTGPTNIAGGTLALGAAGSINSSSSISVGNGAIFDVSAVTGGYTVGTQTITGAGGTVHGAATLGNTSTFLANIALGASNPTLVFDSSLTIGPSSSITVTGTPNGTSSYVLLSYLGSESGTFGNITIPSGYTLDYGSGTNSTITMTPAPEPASLALLGIGAAGLLGRRRRKAV